MKFSSNRVTVADTFSKEFKFRDTRKKMIRTALNDFAVFRLVTISIIYRNQCHLFLRERVLVYHPSPIDTNVNLFIQEHVLVYHPSLIDTNFN